MNQGPSAGDGATLCVCRMGHDGSARTKNKLWIQQLGWISWASGWVKAARPKGACATEPCPFHVCVYVPGQGEDSLPRATREPDSWADRNVPSWGGGYKGECNCQKFRNCTHNIVKSLSHVRLFVIPWTVAYQAPLSMEFSRQEYWSGLPFPSPGDLPHPGIEPRSPALQADSVPA